MRHVLLAAALLCIAIPGAADGTLSADTVATSGGGTLAGPLRAFDLEAADGMPRDLALRVVKGEAVIQHRDSNQTMAGLRVEPQGWPETIRLDGKTLVLDETGTTATLFAASSLGGSVQIEAQADRWTGTAGGGPAKQTPHVLADGGRPLEVPAEGATQWSGDGARLTLQGSLVLVVWDMTLSGDGVTLWTGSESRDRAGPVWREEREAEAYLYLEEATVTMTLGEIPEGALLVEDAVVAGPDGLTFTGAAGVVGLKDGEAAVDGTVTVPGPASARIGAAGDRVTASLLEPPTALVGDASTVAPVARTALDWWVWAALALVLAAVAAASAAVRRARDARLLARLQTAMAAGDFAKAAELAPGRLRRGRHAAEASVLRVTAAIRLGRHRDAERLLERWPRAAYPWDRDYLRAHLHALRGQWPEAVRALTSSLAQAPELAAAAAADPILSRLARGHASPEGYS
jgi:tetratricopeptide (TPR) repeat protein